MLTLPEKYPQYQFIIAGAPSQEVSFYESLIQQENVTLIQKRTYDILVPQVVCYKGSALSYAIAKRIVKLEYISLVNLIMNKLVVTELIQNDFTDASLLEEFEAIMNTSKRDVMLKEYDSLEIKLGGIGASEKTAISIIKILNNE